MDTRELSNQEKTATGYTHVAYFDVANGDLETTLEVVDVLSLGVGWQVNRAAIFITTAFVGLTTPTLDLGVAATGVAATDLITAAANTADLLQLDSLAGAPILSLASEFITVQQNGTGGPATAGAGYIYIEAADATVLNQQTPNPPAS